MTTPPDAAARRRQAMDRALQLLRAVGARAADLYRKVHKDKSPEGMLAGLDESIAANAARRTRVAAELETAHAGIVSKKREYATASAARQRILKAELTSLMAAYEACERELKVLLENDRVLTQTRGRIQELAAYAISGVREEQIDRVADEIGERAADAEARLGALKDLDRAGRRRESEDADDFTAKLAAFDEPAAAAPERAEQPPEREAASEQAPPDLSPSPRREPAKEDPL